MRNGIFGLGGKLTDIIEIEDADFHTMSQLFSSLRNVIFDNYDRGREKTLIFIYYAGHGVMTNKLENVCNPPKPFDPNKKQKTEY